MSENREEILADFQACTGIEDVGEAIYHLEESNWDLLAAVNRVMPQETQTLPSEMDVDVEMIEEIKQEPTNPVKASPDITVVSCVGSDCSLPFKLPVSVSADVIPLPSTSQSESSTRLLQFCIHFREKLIQLQLPDTGTVGDLKTLVTAQLGIPTCQQCFEGWKSYPSSDFTILGSLGLPKENILFLTIPNNVEDGEFSTKDSNIAEKLIQSYTLNIHDESQQKDYSLKFLGSKTVLEVKTDVYTLTDIPVRHQVWTGWPSQLKNDRTTLACSGIHPVHEFTVKRAFFSAHPAKENKKFIVDLADSDNSSVEEFEDASETFTEDDIFVDVETKRMQPLIPNNVEDETAGCIHFADQFTNRYGDCHPEFFPGSLDEAVKEACLKPAKDRRLLAVYLHHDGSILTNVFCTQLLGFESVLQCLNNHFVVWGWDLTHESNKLKFLGSVTRTLGSVAAMTIRNIEVERLPALLIIMRMRSATEVFTIVHGNVGVSELLTSLIQAVDVFTEQQRMEIREEDERAARELVKREQDAAYQESLEADRAKEEAKRHQELMENKEKEQREIQRQEVELIKEAHRLEVKSQLPEEPQESAGDCIAKIRFRLPKGECLVRRFQATAPLKVLLDFLVVQGYPPDEYKVISSWPRKDLTSLDPKVTLQELKFFPQETVILEER
ncbi:FAS-associated factor 1 [Zootermopsis nevadensis]|uniref:FAS-associated factor 1 n=1 Tax=Zootermopsis nevadensis TaxID=136037 RepID=A0A067QUL8_ZOONE|nr:FAS-associated factor 1 [Zootermopsis nevadensis]KDR09433.1 FAS-associated factor 1 [Zootermopsis nevadensis]